MHVYFSLVDGKCGDGASVLAATDVEQLLPSLDAPPARPGRGERSRRLAVGAEQVTLVAQM